MTGNSNIKLLQLLKKFKINGDIHQKPQQMILRSLIVSLISSSARLFVVLHFSEIRRWFFDQIGREKTGLAGRNWMYSNHVLCWRGKEHFEFIGTMIYGLIRHRVICGGSILFDFNKNDLYLSDTMNPPFQPMFGSSWSDIPTSFIQLSYVDPSSLVIFPTFWNFLSGRGLSSHVPISTCNSDQYGDSNHIIGHYFYYC